MMKHVFLSEQAEAQNCSHCLLGHICIPKGLNRENAEKLADLVKERIRIPKGENLFKAGDPVKAIYSIRSGSLKAVLENASGQMQITGFFLPGEFVGLDGVWDKRQHTNAIALEDTEVCVISFDEMESLSRTIPELQKQFYRLMSQEIDRVYNMTLSLATLTSEQRVATFLLTMSERLSNLGYSEHEFLLRMTRFDIGNYLGLTLETVSRLMSKMSKDGVISVEKKLVKINDVSLLRKIVNQEHIITMPKRTHP
ncbi:fumarate/nitrate reduction transcriptional regulator Fnr [Basilea psittacipulmonis]|uniref:Transcriptional regulatory protein btr n=1 Tax=Basilea psittacipulmonis DSM 24701 TaxID=1072685 RepID=A0A077DBX3_9BURK|nr:fumarate/nitrate reduction transcriptional regulator Fnr [Basilea psittacipulmonis]AIL32345.1 transcriptional regulatory protein btr [Basilea psittacipulmonis DSM 24701]